nr:hypothetical protein [Tanacetum cinerariifolium]
MLSPLFRVPVVSKVANGLWKKLLEQIMRRWEKSSETSHIAHPSPPSIQQPDHIFPVQNQIYHPRMLSPLFRVPVVSKGKTIPGECSAGFESITGHMWACYMLS